MVMRRRQIVEMEWRRVNEGARTLGENDRRLNNWELGMVNEELGTAVIPNFLLLTCPPHNFPICHHLNRAKLCCREHRDAHRVQTVND